MDATVDSLVRARTAPTWQERRVTMRDGLSLAVRDYRPDGTGGEPAILCLAGLTRNAQDFDDLARDLQARGARVVCIDSRGRGRSDRDKNWRNYHPVLEAEDAIAVTDALGLDHYAVIGTSRGGILAMVMAAMRAGQMTRVVLNDIGPRIEAEGLARIKSYLGRALSPKDWDDATRIVREAGAGTFPDRSDAEWREVAGATFVETKKGLAPDFDPALIKSLTDLDLSQPLPDLWPQFRGLRRIPVLALRGALSDLLSAETLRAMEQAFPKAKAVTVPAAGHAPSLNEPVARRAILAFLGL